MGWFFLALLLLLAAGASWLGVRRDYLHVAWHADLAALAALWLATMGFFWRVVAGQNWMPADGGDLVSFLYPTYRFAAAALHQGAWPFWNPHLYLGAPHVADIQAGFLYPPNLLLFLLRPDFPYGAMQWLSIGHVWFAGAGMYLLLARGVHLKRIAAFAGALAFMFSDAFIVHFGNYNFNAVASWTPWVFWAYLAGLNTLGTQGKRRKWLPILLWAAVAGILLAISTLAGHIQATLFLLLALFVYTVLWLWLQRAAPQPLQRGGAALLYLAAACAMMTLLAAPVLLPAVQLTGYTTRAGWNYTDTAGYSVSPAQWIGWLIPGFFGRGPQFHWGAWPRVEVGYLGILPLILAGLGFLLRRDRNTLVWSGLALASFVLALGIYAIPHGWLSLLPGFGQLRAPARFVLVTDFALAALAGIGLDAILEPLGDAGRQVLGRAEVWLGRASLAVWAIGVPLAYVALLLTQDRDQAIVLRVSITLIAVMTFAGLLLASLLWLIARRRDWAQSRTLGWLAAGLIFLDLASTGAYQDLGNTDPSRTFEHPQIAGFLASQPGPFRVDARTGIESLWQPDTALLYGLDDIGGLDNPLQLADASRYWEGMGSRSSPLYDLLNARYVIARKDVTLDWDKFALAFDGDPQLNVFANRRALPRAFLVSQAVPVADHEAAWQAIHAFGFDPAVTGIVEGASKAISDGRGSVTAIRAEVNGVLIEANVDRPALLVVSQMWYPGWQVWLDGVRQAGPLRVDYTFQGLLLPEGAHRVELRFSPPLWHLGWGLVGLAILALVCLMGLALLRRPKNAPPPGQ